MRTSFIAVTVEDEESHLVGFAVLDAGDPGGTGGCPPGDDGTPQGALKPWKTHRKIGKPWDNNRKSWENDENG